MTQETQGFDLYKMATTIRGRLGYVRLVYEGFIDWEPTLPKLQALTGASGNEAGTVKQVLTESGVLRRMDELEAAHKVRGHTVPDGYLISIIQESGHSPVQNVNIDKAMTEQVHDGDVVSITGRLSGR